ncbi:MAG: hypothetical protein O4805_01545 [Trichodesmium sp. St16_bin2-tuft]|nr:hypothetical protein [Trichodesmium sp. St16_bin2-tuft]
MKNRPSQLSVNGYFLSFVLEVLPEVFPKNADSVGIDLGIKTFTTLGTFCYGSFF